VPDWTGTVDDECFVGSEDRDWYAYWRLLFAQVHESDIVNFETKYKGNFLSSVTLMWLFLIRLGVVWAVNSIFVF